MPPLGERPGYVDDHPDVRSQTISGRTTAYEERKFGFGGRGFSWWVPADWTDEQVQEACATVLADALEALAEARSATL